MVHMIWRTERWFEPSFNSHNKPVRWARMRDTDWAIDTQMNVVAK